MRVLRLCSVYEAPPETLTGTRAFDAFGGMQVHTARLTEGLDALGVEQTVITAYRPGAPRTQRVGARSRVIRTGAHIRRFRQLYGVASVPEVLRAGGVDLVHVHLGEDVAIVPLARWAASRAGVPLVATVHCSVQHTLVGHDARSTIIRAIGGPAQSRLLRAAGAVLVLTDRLAERLVGTGIPASRVRVVPIGIDPGNGRRLPRPASMDEGRWIVYAGRLVREKGVRELLEAFGKLSVEGAGLMIVGDGRDRAALEIAAGLLGTDRRVRFVGAVPQPDVRPYLEHADVVVLPSWYEERGRVLLEAMAAGTPVVASRTGGIPATVCDGKNGLLVPPRDAGALATAIDRVLGDDDLAASMGAAGRATASEHGIDGLVAATLATYEAVLDRASEPRRASLQRVGAP